MYYLSMHHQSAKGDQDYFAATQIPPHEQAFVLRYSKE